MKTLNVDDDTYSKLQQQAAAGGITIEELLKRTTERIVLNGRSVDQLTAEERLERLHNLYEFAADHGGQADFSRDAIYD